MHFTCVVLEKYYTMAKERRAKLSLRGNRLETRVRTTSKKPANFNLNLSHYHYDPLNPCIAPLQQVHACAQIASMYFVEFKL